jgi:tetratricopeptide (TPR) repeat protein
MRNLLLLFAACVLCLGCGEDADLTPAEQYLRGMEALASGDAGEAEQLFSAMVAADPADPVARASLARALARQDRFAEAIVQDKLALAADPTLAEMAYNVACSYAALGDTDESLRWLSRAWDGGVRDLNLIEQDPDLRDLRRDHRFAFFLATGSLSLQEREAFARVTPALAAPGDEVTVEITVVSLNRPLMAAPEPLELRFGGALAEGALVPLARTERFEAGESGGREFFRRNINLTFRAERALETLLEPIHLALGDTQVPVRPSWLSVRDVLPDLFPRQETDEDEVPPPSAEDWFAAPGTLTGAVEHPFARWEESDEGAWDLLVGVEIEGDGLEVPADLVLADPPAGCGPWVHPRRTAFLRTRAEGDSRVWFHRRFATVVDGRPDRGECPALLPVQVILGGEVVLQSEVPWP